MKLEARDVIEALKTATPEELAEIRQLVGVVVYGAPWVPAWPTNPNPLSVPPIYNPPWSCHTISTPSGSVTT